jgi:hypothetical protein
MSWVIVQAPVELVPYTQALIILLHEHGITSSLTYKDQVAECLTGAGNGNERLWGMLADGAQDGD